MVLISHSKSTLIYVDIKTAKNNKRVGTIGYKKLRTRETKEDERAV
jgi:hypothetical protein